MFDVDSPDPDRLVLQESTPDRVRPAVFAFVTGAIAMQLAGPAFSIPSHRMRFATLFAAVCAGALWLLRPGRFVADRSLACVESSLGWRSLLRQTRVIPFAQIQAVRALATMENEFELQLLLASQECFVVASDLEAGQAEEMGHSLAALIHVRFETATAGW